MFGSYFIQQGGTEPVWIKGTVAATRYLCDVFGITGDDKFMNICNQLDSIKRNQVLSHKDLGIEITRF